jgi:hypothetical protein
MGGQERGGDKRRNYGYADKNVPGYPQQQSMAPSEEPTLIIRGAGTVPEFFQVSLHRWNGQRQARGERPLQISFVN